jgi:hypothetical protein
VKKKHLKKFYDGMMAATAAATVVWQRPSHVRITSPAFRLNTGSGRPRVAGPKTAGNEGKGAISINPNPRPRPIGAAAIRPSVGLDPGTGTITPDDGFDNQQGSQCPDCQRRSRIPPPPPRLSFKTRIRNFFSRIPLRRSNPTSTGKQQRADSGRRNKKATPPVIIAIIYYTI